jgi:hypothetical protein
MLLCESNDTGLIMEELLPNLKHDMQGFPNKEISKPAIHDKECSVRSSENIDK